MLPNLYYRSVEEPDGDEMPTAGWSDGVTPTNIVAIPRAFAAAADDPAARDDGRSGRLLHEQRLALWWHALLTGRRDRLIHGAYDTEDSPHLGLETVRAEVHFAWVVPDGTAPPETIAVMEQALNDAGVTYTIDRETDAQHGFAPAGPRHDPDASERHWARVFDLLDRKL